MLAVMSMLYYATVSWVPLGAGEEMMNKALINLYTMLGTYVLKL